MQFKRVLNKNYIPVTTWASIPSHLLPPTGRSVLTEIHLLHLVFLQAKNNIRRICSHDMVYLLLNQTSTRTFAEQFSIVYGRCMIPLQCGPVAGGVYIEGGCTSVTRSGRCGQPQLTSTEYIGFILIDSVNKLSFTPESRPLLF